jgi:uncharacterized membrane protein YphA (DoxX/SURF4 family)
MSLFFKAQGSSSIGLLFLRLAAGTYTLALGILQLSNVQGYINKIKAMGILSDNTAFIFGFVAPFLLIVFGSLYIMGFFTPAASFVLALISLIKIFARGLFPSEGIPFNKDIIIFACFVMTLFSGAGKISFDVFLDKKKKVKVETKTGAAAEVEKTSSEKTSGEKPSSGKTSPEKTSPEKTSEKTSVEKTDTGSAQSG